MISKDKLEPPEWYDRPGRNLGDIEDPVPRRAVTNNLNITPRIGDWRRTFLMGGIRDNYRPPGYLQP